MDWLFFALLAPALWAIVNIIDKFLVDKHLQNPATLWILDTLIGSLVIIIVPFVEFYIPDTKILILCLIAGALTFIADYPYYLAMKREEASRVIPLYSISPFFVLIMSYFLLNERLTQHYYIGFFLVLAGGIIISIKSIEGKFSFSKAYWLIFFSSIVYAIVAVLLKYLFTVEEFWPVFVLSLIGSAICSVLILITNKRIRRTTTSFLVRSKKTILLLTTVSAIINIMAFFAADYAIFKGPVSIVKVLVEVQQVFVFILALIVSSWAPWILKEEINKRTFATKIVSIALMIAGIIFIYI